MSRSDLLETIKEGYDAGSPKFSTVAIFKTFDWTDKLSKNPTGTVVHAATFLCTSANGDAYFWTKNGGNLPPTIMTQTQIETVYSGWFNTTKLTGYFNPKISSK